MIKITEDLVKEINEYFSKVPTYSAVAKKFNISIETVKKYLTSENIKKADESWQNYDALWYYVFKLFGQHSVSQPVSQRNIILMHRFNEQGYCYKGQLMTLKYFYEIKKNPVRQDKLTIGIIPYIWEDSRRYYMREAQKAQQIREDIRRQLKKDRLEIPYNPRGQNFRKRKKPIDLKALEKMGE